MEGSQYLGDKTMYMYRMNHNNIISLSTQVTWIFLQSLPNFLRTHWLLFIINTGFEIKASQRTMFGQKWVLSS